MAEFWIFALFFVVNPNFSQVAQVVCLHSNPVDELVELWQIFLRHGVDKQSSDNRFVAGNEFTDCHNERLDYIFGVFFGGVEIVLDVLPCWNQGKIV